MGSEGLGVGLDAGVRALVEGRVAAAVGAAEGRIAQRRRAEGRVPVAEVNVLCFFLYILYL